jgi:2'-5' RNA ligase
MMFLIPRRIILMRLFTAVELPGEVRKALHDAGKGIGNDTARIKWVEEENIHLTLKFLGEVHEGKAREIKAALESVASGHFNARVTGFGVFPGYDYVRVIWAGLEPRDSFEALHEGIERALSPLGFAHDRRFIPHVTIGRVRSVSDKKALSEALKSLDAAGAGREFAVDGFRLKKSTLTPKGPVYEDISSFPLK